MGRVIAALAVEVHRRVARVIGRFTRTGILALEALERSPRLDQGPVDGEVFVREQLPRTRLRHHCPKEFIRHRVFQQPRAVARKSRVVEAWLAHIHVEEPAKQQVVIELLTKHAFAAHRI